MALGYSLCTFSNASVTSRCDRRYLLQTPSSVFLSLSDIRMVTFCILNLSCHSHHVTPARNVTVLGVSDAVVNVNRLYFATLFVLFDFK